MELEEKVFKRFLRKKGGVLEPLCDYCAKAFEDYRGYYTWKCGKCKAPYKAAKYDFGGKTVFIYLLDTDKSAPMGLSQWREHGRKYGYWDYFKKENASLTLA